MPPGERLRETPMSLFVPLLEFNLCNEMKKLILTLAAGLFAVSAFAAGDIDPLTGLRWTEWQKAENKEGLGSAVFGPVNEVYYRSKLEDTRLMGQLSYSAELTVEVENRSNDNVMVAVEASLASNAPPGNKQNQVIKTHGTQFFMFDIRRSTEPIRPVEAMYWVTARKAFFYEHPAEK
jgi:hypothetical protein